jgi:hypothetical protein
MWLMGVTGLQLMKPHKDFRGVIHGQVSDWPFEIVPQCLPRGFQLSAPAPYRRTLDGVGFDVNNAGREKCSVAGPMQLEPASPA